MKRTYITRMPDKAGAFLKASRLISAIGGNIVRVSYNKALDTHTLFIEVAAEKEQLDGIAEGMEELGYIAGEEGQKAILISLTLPDVPGALTPILEVLAEYDINISYMNSQENGTGVQHFKMGLLPEQAGHVDELLDRLARICEVGILEYDVTGKQLDNTVFYVSFANEMRRLLGLDQQQTNEFLINSNRIMQILDDKGEPTYKTFDFIRRFARFVAGHGGENFHANTGSIRVSPQVTMTWIEPPCGSNTYILEYGDDLLFIDNGFACYAAEMEELLRGLLPGYGSSRKSLLLTHGDIDHTGNINAFDKVYVSQDCFDNFRLEAEGGDGYREQDPLHLPYSRLSKIISGYIPPDMDRLDVIAGSPGEDFGPVGDFIFGDMRFQVYAGGGGHVRGETMLICDSQRIAFTGDNYVNIKGFSPEQQEFNALAPYLMTSVNMDSEKAGYIRRLLLDRVYGYTLCPGHGKIFK